LGLFPVKQTRNKAFFHVDPLIAAELRVFSHDLRRLEHIGKFMRFRRSDFCVPKKFSTAELSYGQPLHSFPSVVNSSAYFRAGLPFPRSV